jgi:hypothetical protein
MKLNPRGGMTSFRKKAYGFQTEILKEIPVFFQYFVEPHLSRE